MSFPKYEAYRDSGVEWLGEVPEHWELMPFFSRFRERNEKNTGLKDNNLLSLSYGHIIQKDINALDGLLPESFETYQIVNPYDIVFRLTDLQNDKRSLRSAIVRQRGIITSAYLAVESINIDPSFAHHLFRAYDLIKVFYSMGGGLRQSMKYSDMKWLPLLAPPLSEQTQIARFLDYETARIDALIAEQQRLIELLKEKRQAVISHAVTKGLDPTAPLKDSGVEWLGEVPAHWEILKLARVLQTVEQGWSPNASNEAAEIEKWGVIKISAVKNGNFVETENKALLEDTLPDSSLKVRKGDLLVTRANTPDLVGDTCVVDKDPDSHLMLSDLTYRLRLNDKIYTKFICFFLLSSFGRAQIKGDARGSSMSMAKISQGHIKSWIIALPEYDEQLKITEYLSVELEKMNCLMETCNETKKLLQERRSALISAAVTGKIDVRGWQAPASAALTPTLEATHG